MATPTGKRCSERSPRLCLGSCQEKRSPRQVLHRPDRADDHPNGGPEHRLNTRPPARAGKTFSSQLALDKWDFPNFFMIDRPMAEVAVFSEQLAVIGQDRDEGVFRNSIEQLFHYTV